MLPLVSSVLWKLYREQTAETRLQCVSFVFQTGDEAEEKEVHLQCFREPHCKSGQCPAAGNVQHKRTGCLASGPAEAHCSCDLQADRQLLCHHCLQSRHGCSLLTHTLLCQSQSPQQRFGNVAVWNTEISTARQLLTELPSRRAGKQGQ